MPLPEYPPVLVQAPAWAGIGLRRELEQGWAKRPPHDWPADWWQRNFDTWEPEELLEPLTERQQRVPPAPAVTP